MPQNLKHGGKRKLDKQETKTADGTEQTTPETQTEVSAEEAAIHAQEHDKALHDIGEEQPQPPAPFDLGGENIPAPGDNADLADSIPQKQTAEQAEKDKSAQEPPATEEQAPAKKVRSKPPKADKAEKARPRPAPAQSPKRRKSNC